MTNVTRNALNN